MELDASVSEITTEVIPNILIPNNKDEILLTVRQKVRSTSWIWTSSGKGRVQVRWQIPFVDTDYGRTHCFEGDRNCQDDNYKRECWKIDGKKTCA